MAMHEPLTDAQLIEAALWQAERDLGLPPGERAVRPGRGMGRPDEDEGEDASTAELIRHNEAFDRWERMGDGEREREIRDAIRRA